MCPVIADISGYPLNRNTVQSSEVIAGEHLIGRSLHRLQSIKHQECVICDFKGVLGRVSGKQDRMASLHLQALEHREQQRLIGKIECRSWFV